MGSQKKTKADLLRENGELRERLRRLEAAESSRDRLQTILDHADVLVFDLDREGVVRSVEGKILRDHKIDPALLLGRNTVECYTHRPEIAEHVRAALAGCPRRYIAIHLGREFECHLNPIRDASGEVSGVVVVGVDMASRRGIEQSLRESQERLSLATRAAGIGLWHLDLASGRMDWDQRQCELYGVPPEQKSFTCEFWLSRLHPEDQDRAYRIAMEEVKVGVEYHDQFRILLPDGTVRHLEAHASIRRDRLGKALAVTGVSWDITGAMVTNQRLAESRLEYSQLFQTMLDGFALHEMIFDAAGRPCDYRFLQVNPAFEKMTGLDAGAVVGCTVLELLPATEQEWIERYGRVVATGEPASFELVSGSLGKTFEVAAYRPSAGRFACIFRDVTERLRAEQRLRAERQVLDALNSSEPQRQIIRRLLHIIREETGVEAVGIRLRDGDDYPYYEHHGFSADFIRAECSLRLPPGKSGSSCGYHLACLCGRVIRGETDPALSFFTRGGSFWTNQARQLLAGADAAMLGVLRGRCPKEGYESLALIPLASGGEVIGLLQLNDRRPGCFTSEDIEFYETLGGSIGVSVARDHEQQALRRSKESLHHILDSLEAGVVAMDEATDSVTSANPAAARMLGMPRDFLIGLPARRLSPTQEALVSGEGELLAMDGRRVPVLRTVSRVDLNGRPSLLLSFLDLTALREAEVERHHFQERLNQAQRLEAIGTLAGGIAHDFNNILHAILGFAELALDDCPEGSEAWESVREVMKSSHRARDLINQILTFSRQGENERVPLRMQSIVKEIGKLMRGTLPASVVVSTQVASDAPSVLADPTQMHQVLMNLCTNAYQAIQRRAEGEQGVLPEGRIRIQAQARQVDEVEARKHPGLTAGPHLELTVSDTGSGIPPDIQKHIFEPYFTTRAKERGTGLGLAIVQGIVQAHGGAIYAQSTPGQGAVFHILLPAYAEAEADDLEWVQQVAASRLEHARVLFVDDEAAIRQLAEMGLPQYGYRLTLASDGKMALDLLCRDPEAYDILVTDLTMPRMSGVELAREALRLRPDLPILICTGFSGDLSHEEALRLGIRELVFKPLTSCEMDETIRRVLQPSA